MPLADTLLRLAEAPALYEPRWRNEILAEVTRTLIGRFGKTPEKAVYRETAMRAFLPEALIGNYRHHVAAMNNHPKDRHVLAAAVACRADYVITINMKDFVTPSADTHGVSVIGPSTFLIALMVFDRTVVEERLSEQAAAIGIRTDELLERLVGSLRGFVALLAF